jgi:hypothetical protein
VAKIQPTNKEKKSNHKNKNNTRDIFYPGQIIEELRHAAYLPSNSTFENYRACRQHPQSNKALNIFLKYDIKCNFNFITLSNHKNKLNNKYGR